MDIEDLKVDFNAVITSGGGTLSERQFLIDFKSLIGKSIPFKQLGHPDLKSLLKSIGGYSFSTRGNETIIHSQGDEKTAHIASLIARQKKKPGKPKARKLTTYRRPIKPPPLRYEVRRRSPVEPVVYSRVQRQPPPPRYGNPPIIPQRQPLSTAQSRLDLPKKETPSVSPPSVSRGTINVQEAHTRILNDKPDSRLHDNSNSKVSQFVEEAEDTNFVDIQWLQAKVQAKKTVLPSLMSLPVNSVAVSSSPVVQAKKTVLPSLMSLPVNSVAKSTNEISVSHPEQSIVFKSNVEELNTLASKLGLASPNFIEKTRKPFRGKPVYTAKVKLGDDLTFTSYPEEKPTPQEAKELVAQLACEELRRRINKLTIEQPRLAETEILHRVYQIVEPKVNGIFEEAVVEAYEDAYKTSIPASWLDVIRKSTKFSIENFTATRTIIYPVTEDLSQLRPTVSTKDLDTVKASNVVPKTTVSQSPTENSVPAVAPKCNGGVSSAKRDINFNTVTVTDLKAPPGLVLPACNTWDVFVTSAGTHDVWIRLIGDDYDAKYNDVMTDLEIKMVTHDEIVTNPQVEDYYCIKCDSCYIRVQLKEIISEEECEVFLIDNGETDTISVTDLRVLPNEYLSLPAQAIQCRLSYLDISYPAAQNYLIQNVVGSSFVAEVLKKPSLRNPLAHIILHNTENTEKNVNINYCILEEILKTMEPPQLTQRHLSLLRVTHVEPETSPYCQVQGQDLTFLETILQEIYENLDLDYLHGLDAHPRMGTNHQKKQFLCKFRNTWRRGTILECEDNRNPIVYFIDYGHRESVMLQDIFDLDKVFPPLKHFPAQAMQVNLVDVPASKLNIGVIHRLVELAPPDMFVISKCINVAGGVPEVELFMRVQPNNMMASLNTDLTFNFDEYTKRTLDELKSISSLPQGGSGGCTLPLEKYPLPPVDSGFFDVYVSMTSNPHNFVVQPLKNMSEFNATMKSLNEHYERQHGVRPVPAVEELIENAAFAAKHPEDGTWYRVSIVTPLRDSMVSVRYSDWGDVGLVSIDRLRYLEPRFRTIPALAIRAKLHGVKPKENAEWTVDQCLVFNELVDSKSFVSRVMHVNSESNLNSWQLSLYLIDTSSENVDVDIGEVLVSKQIAIFDQ